MRKSLKLFKKIHQNVQNWFILRQQKIKFKPECLAWSCHYATGCFVAFLGDISILKSDRNMKKIFSRPTAFSLSTPVDNSEATWKKLQNATNTFTVLWSSTLLMDVIVTIQWGHTLMKLNFIFLKSNLCF